MLRKRSPLPVTLLLLTIATMLISTATPVSADTAVVRDRGGDVRHGMDIRWVRVENGPSLVITVQHRAIRERDGAWAGIYIDVAARGRGPEYYLAGGAGTDYQYFLMDGWRISNRIYGCRYRQSFNYRLDRSRFVVSRACLNGANFQAGRVRVAAIAGTKKGRRDWAPAYRGFSPWIGVTR